MPKASQSPCPTICVHWILDPWSSQQTDDLTSHLSSLGGAWLVCVHFLDIRQPTSNCQLGQTRTAKVSQEEYRLFLEGCDEVGVGGAGKRVEGSQVTGGRAVLGN